MSKRGGLQRSRQTYLQHVNTAQVSRQPCNDPAHVEGVELQTPSYNTVMLGGREEGRGHAQNHDENNEPDSTTNTRDYVQGCPLQHGAARCILHHGANVAGWKQRRLEVVGTVRILRATLGAAFSVVQKEVYITEDATLRLLGIALVATFTTRYTHRGAQCAGVIDEVALRALKLVTLAAAIRVHFDLSCSHRYATGVNALEAIKLFRQSARCYGSGDVERMGWLLETYFLDGPYSWHHRPQLPQSPSQLPYNARVFTLDTHRVEAIRTLRLALAHHVSAAPRKQQPEDCKEPHPP